MTDWGSHGAGTDSEIFTPFIFWGSGIKPFSTQQLIDQVLFNLVFICNVSVASFKSRVMFGNLLALLSPRHSLAYLSNLTSDR